MFQSTIFQLDCCIVNRALYTCIYNVSHYFFSIYYKFSLLIVGYVSKICLNMEFCYLRMKYFKS